MKKRLMTVPVLALVMAALAFAGGNTDAAEPVSTGAADWGGVFADGGTDTAEPVGTGAANRGGAFPQTKPRLAILPFTGGSGRDGDAIANIFSNSGDLKQEFDIVPRTSSVDSMIREQQFQRSFLTDSDAIASLGNMMNADYVVSGHITPFRNINLLLISIVNVQTLQQTAGDYREYAKVEDIRALLPQMAQNIIKSIREQNTPSKGGLAVLPLNILDTAVEQGDAEILAQILAIEIANGHQYAVFPRTTTIEAVMRELQIQRSGLTDPETMKRIGVETKAEYVLAGTITKLGDMNMFDVKILHIENGIQAEGIDLDYANLSDGIALMGELAYGLTGVKAGGTAEAGRVERETASAQPVLTKAEQQRLDKEQKKRETAAEKERKRQVKAEERQRNREIFKSGMNEFLWGGVRFFGIGANLGVGLGNDAGLGFNMVGNMNATVPLVWRTFADVGADLGFSGSIGGTDTHEDTKYAAYRLYARFNIGIPFDLVSWLLLPYAGVGYGYTKASYEFAAEENWVEMTGMREHEYSGIDLAFGVIVTGRHHGIRIGANLNNILKKTLSEAQITLGYTFLFQ
jgi:TolB-like protein